MKTFNFTVPPEQGGKRLDLYLMDVLAAENLSRRKIRQVIDVGGVYVNKKRVRIASRQVVRGDKVRIEYSEAGLKQLKGKPVTFKEEDILLEVPGLFALNKPPGMPSQATKDQSIQHVVTCLDAVLKARAEKQKHKLILVHRLDKETSGVILVADGSERATWLTDRFRGREVKKTYLAICYGIPKRESFTEKAHLSEIDKRTGDVRIVHAGGRPAVTHVKLLAKNEKLGICLLECRPETGRSHQIRVHLETNGLPIIGDKRYGARFRRDLPPELGELASVHHFLHARRLEFQPGPDAKPLEISAPPPERFAAFLRLAGLEVSI